MQKESDILKTIPEISLASMQYSPGQKPFNLSIGSRHCKLRDLPTPKFVEPAVS